MSPRRRLTGIAAMSAVTLATAGIAGATVAADESDGVAELRALIEAFGGGEVPDEALTQMLAMYEAMGMDPAAIFGMADPELLAALGSSGLAFPKVEDAGESDELDPQADLFAKMFADAAGGEGIDEDAFLKLILGEMGLDDAAFPKLEDQVFPKVEIEDADGAAFLKLESSLADVQDALAAAATQGDIDAATYQQILELLAQE